MTRSFWTGVFAIAYREATVLRHDQAFLSMIVAQPDVSTPILLRFPFPAWATRPSEAGATGAGRDPFARFRE